MSARQSSPPPGSAELSVRYGLSPDAPHLVQALTHPSYANERREARPPEHRRAGVTRRGGDRPQNDEIESKLRRTGKLALVVARGAHPLEIGTAF